MSDSVRPHRQPLRRLPCPWDSPGKNTGMGCHFLLQCMKVKSESEVAQSCPTLSDPRPKIRIGAMAGDRVRLQTRGRFVLTTRKVLGTELAVSVSFPGLTRAVKKGDPILLGDGEIELEALQVSKDEVRCRIVVGGILGSHK